MKNIGDKLRQLRTKKNKTQDEVASVIGISKSALAMYETGRRVPRDEIKIKIAAYYKVSIVNLFFDY